MEPIKLKNQELVREIKAGKEPYVQVDDRKFLMVEVNQTGEPAPYEVKDPTEKKELLQAIERDNPILTEQEINKLLQNHEG